MSNIKKIFAMMFAVMAVILMHMVVFADSTKIKDVNFEADFVIEMQPQHGDTIPAPNFRITSTDPNEAIDALYIDETKPLGWYCNGKPCTLGDKFEYGNTYILNMTVAIKASYTNSYYFYYQNGWIAGNSHLLNNGTVYATTNDAKTLVLSKVFYIQATENDPPKINNTTTDFEVVTGDDFSLKLNAYDYYSTQWSIVGTLPDNLNLNGNEISGYFSKAGNYSITTKATNINGSDTKTFNIVVKDDGSYVKRIYLEGDYFEPQLGAEIKTYGLKIVSTYPEDAKDNLTLIYDEWAVAKNEPTIAAQAMEFINVTSYCFQDKTYEYTLKIKNKAFGKWDLGKTVIYINGVSIKDLGKYATRTEYSSATDPEDCGVYGNIVFNKLDYNNIFCEEPEDQVAWEGQTQFDVSWRTIFKPVKVEIWNNGEIKETITDMGFSSSQLSTLNYTMTHTLERSPYLYTVRAYYGNGGTDYIDSREFLLSYHKALLLSQPTDTMIPSGESGVPLGWEVNFTPVKVDFYKNGDKVDTLTDSSIKYYMFTEGKWYLAIYESERYLSRPAVFVETDEFVVSKYAKPVITSQPTAETVPYIGGGTNVKIEADNAYSYLWMLKDEKGYIYSWSSASELGWCDMVGTSYKSDTLVLENVSEEMAKKNIYCIVYDQGGNISVTSDWIKLDVAKKLNSVSVTIPGLEKLCAGDFVDDYRNVVVNTEHCTEGTAVWSSASSVFKEGENAFVFVLVNCEEGYTFTDSPDCYINKEKVNLTNRQDGYVSFSKKITVPEAEYLKGDINNNGYVDDTDAALLLKHIGVKNILSDEQIEKAELTNDGKSDILDVIWILNHKTTA